MLAVSRGRELGIDIEQEQPIDEMELAVQCFSLRERDELKSFRKDERLKAFYRGWTRKESFVKANGLGLSFSLQGFDVSLSDAPGNLLLNSEKDPALCERWTTQYLSAPPGFCAAVTVERTGWRIVQQEMSREQMLWWMKFASSAKHL
jgi:4'-phosphopantetheinyl transferase